MREALESARASAAAEATTVTAIRPVTRLIVLPFRLLRPDPEIDFLAVALPDAITASLCGLESLVVRSTASASRWAAADPDLQRLAAEAEVDAVLRGTLLRSGAQLRLATQLVEVPSGTVAWSKTLQTPVTDVFELQDELSDRVIEALAIPLSARERLQLERDVPATARAYELYLRANHLGTSVTSTSTLVSARDLYRACLQDDPRFAPAWARLGRVYRIMAKYGHGDWRENVRLAEDAFRRALEVNPELPLAHSYYTYFEIEELGDAPGAMLRLLDRVRARAADPDLFAGLVTVLRFCGLYDASLAAWARARRLDPKIGTSAHYTLFLQGRWADAAANDCNDPPVVSVFSEAILRGPAAALALVRELQKTPIEGVEHHALQYTAGALEGDPLRARASVDGVLSAGFHDPEGTYFGLRALSRVGETERAAELLGSVVERNFLCHEAVAIDPWLEPLRARADVAAVLEESRRRRARAAEAFEAAGGPRLLAMA
jgi:TolB-like protein